MDSLRRWPRGAAPATGLGAELGHTYRAWRVDRSLKTLWLDEARFFDLPRPRRASLVRSQVEHGRGGVPTVRRWSDVLDPAVLRAQADGHRFVWWPSVVALNPRDVLARVASNAPDGAADSAPPSRHAEVAPATWKRCVAKLPAARALAGSFPRGSGPNCFGTVMAAAGIEGAGDECVVESPFLSWMEATCGRGGADDEPGTVLLWRDAAGLPVHAAVTIGDGWAVEKASAEWWTPRAVRTVGEVIRTSRLKGQHLERHRILRTGSSRWRRS